jgi:hypothetical protein
MEGFPWGATVAAVAGIVVAFLILKWPPRSK